MKLESKELLEVIKTFDDYIEVPLSIAHTDVSKYRENFEGIKEIIKNYNDSANDSKDRLKYLTRLTNHLLRLVDDMLEDNTKREYKFTLELKKKNYIIDGLKKYIDSKEELDAEIPSDDEDDEEPTPTSATSGLSDKEKKILGIK
tara:strand:- start:416 stop:850 length:435 start_codon:yes stop_codon:yes gene_type:complete